MKTYILPGLSEKNKEWVDETASQVESIMPLNKIYWPHWESGQTEDGWIEKEAQKVANDIGDEKINIIAKSVGTAVCMALIRLIPEKINKIILCGIPFKGLPVDAEKIYEVLKEFSLDKILIIQNEDDNRGSYIEVENFIHNINSGIKIVSKPRDDHHYPYPEDFIEFLK